MWEGRLHRCVMGRTGAAADALAVAVCTYWMCCTSPCELCQVNTSNVCIVAGRGPDVTIMCCPITYMADVLALHVS